MKKSEIKRLKIQLKATILLSILTPVDETLLDESIALYDAGKYKKSARKLNKYNRFVIEQLEL